MAATLTAMLNWELSNKAKSLNCATSNNVVKVSAADAAYQTAESLPTAKPNQKVVLLVGPHKTGSTSIQANLFNWLHNDAHPSKLSQSWAWPYPEEELTDAGCKEMIAKEPKKWAIIYQWTRAMKWGNDSKRKKLKCLFAPNGTQMHSVDQYLAFYERAFLREWVNGRSLVIASEELDIIGDPKRGMHVLKSVTKQMPWHTNRLIAATGSDSDITAVVVYRSPRSKHLQSIWHECCMDKQSFEDYILHLNGLSWFPVHHLDSLNLAKQFLRQGIKTVLIDLAGVLDKGYDVSKVIACDVLGAACDPEKRFLGGGVDEKAIVANAKSKNHTITPDQMQLIDEAIEEYECNYLTMLGHRNLTILHPFALDKLVEKCRRMGDRDLFGVDVLKDKIVEIAKSGND